MYNEYYVLPFKILFNDLSVVSTYCLIKISEEKFLIYVTNITLNLL